MSTLVSPGASITVQNDSFYAASGSGSVPLVIFASAQDKLVPGSTTTVAAGTTKANAGELFLMTSQRDVLQTFGMPIFQEEDGTVVQGDELNEYGLHGLFSSLGIVNRAYGIRADIDLNALQPTQVEPRSIPFNQTIWFDYKNSDFGIFEHNGGSSANEILNWTKMNVIVPEATDINTTSGQPSNDLGVIGDYAVVPQLVNSNTVFSEITVTSIIGNAINRVWRKKQATGNVWVEVAAPEYRSMTPPIGGSSDDVWVKLDSPAGGLSPAFKKFVAGVWSDVVVTTGTEVRDIEAKRGASLRAGDYSFDASTAYYMYRFSDNAIDVEIPDATVFDGNTVSIEYTEAGKVGIQTLTHVFVDAQTLATFINTNTKLSATAAGNVMTVSSLDGRSFIVRDIDPGATEGVDQFTSTTNWTPANYFVQSSSPTRTATEDTLWYDDSLYADIMINNGRRWCGLQTTEGRALIGSNNAEIVIRQSEPVAKASGGNLEFGDVWLDPADGTEFEFYQYDGNAWQKLDQTDQSTTRGVLFADARTSDENGVGYFSANDSAASTALLTSDYVDPDCPDPRLYPRGMLMVNTAQTGGVVRKYVDDAFTTTEFSVFTGDDSVDHYFVGDPASYPLTGDERTPLTLATVNGNQRSRWVTASGNDLDGSGKFGREAQRKLIVEAMAATIVGSETIRAETVEFNLLSSPGYVELLDELVTLNVDRKETAYIITDVPARLAPVATDVNNWALNADNAPSNGSKGRITRYDYAAQYMGWGLGTNVDGKEVAIPGSSIALRTYLYNDSVAYVWYPPAGTERGVVTNASSVGHINVEGEYTPAVYNQGQRDVMYLNNINPIAMRPNRGLLVWGDKSLAAEASALDRVNVGRLVVYLRTEIEKISERFLFKLNTPSTRENFAAALTSFLANIVQLEGLQDFAVVCDTSNNTALRIDRNELWADIAIQPTKSINFVYVPIRIQNTDA